MIENDVLQILVNWSIWIIYLDKHAKCILVMIAIVFHCFISKKSSEINSHFLLVYVLCA